MPVVVPPIATALRLGTRGSVLARAQTEFVAALLRSLHPGLCVEIQVIQTTGDLRRDLPFAAVGAKGMFVKEIEAALAEGAIDVGVHSLKDMPAELPDGLELACVPQRETAEDALLTRSGQGLEDLPQGARIGTSSLRRAAHLRHCRPDLQVEELRGNLDTRLRRLDEGGYDGIVLACAGLRRLGLAHRISQVLPPSLCTPAPGQGALALESRTGDDRIRAILAPANDRSAAAEAATERAFQARLGGGCSLPAGCLARRTEHGLHVIASAVAPDGGRRLFREQTGADGAAIGAALAGELLAAGAAELMKGAPADA